LPEAGIAFPSIREVPQLPFPTRNERSPSFPGRGWYVDDVSEDGGALAHAGGASPFAPSLSRRRFPLSILATAPYTARRLFCREPPSLSTERATRKSITGIGEMRFSPLRGVPSSIENFSPSLVERTSTEGLYEDAELFFDRDILLPLLPRGTPSRFGLRL